MSYRYSLAIYWCRTSQNNRYRPSLCSGKSWDGRQRAFDIGFNGTAARLILLKSSVTKTERAVGGDSR
jgi:hypothetical protein